MATAQDVPRNGQHKESDDLGPSGEEGTDEDKTTSTKTTSTKTKRTRDVWSAADTSPDKKRSSPLLPSKKRRVRLSSPSCTKNKDSLDVATGVDFDNAASEHENNDNNLSAAFLCTDTNALVDVEKPVCVCVLGFPAAGDAAANDFFVRVHSACDPLASDGTSFVNASLRVPEALAAHLASASGAPRKLRCEVACSTHIVAAATQGRARDTLRFFFVRIAPCKCLARWVGNAVHEVVARTDKETNAKDELMKSVASSLHVSVSPFVLEHGGLGDDIRHCVYASTTVAYAWNPESCAVDGTLALPERRDMSATSAAICRQAFAPVDILMPRWRHAAAETDSDNDVVPCGICHPTRASSCPTPIPNSNEKNEADEDEEEPPIERVKSMLPREAVDKIESVEREWRLLGEGPARSKKNEWLTLIENLPLGKRSPRLEVTPGAMAQVHTAMKNTVHGMTAAKNAVTEMAAKLMVSPSGRSRALLLAGPPGCGKTTFACRALGPALRKPVRVINVGGAKDACFLVGHGYTYEGSRPGRILEEVVSAGVCDPVLVFDEIDKISDTPTGQEIVSVLMQLVDPVQNTAFADTYAAGIPLDMSKLVVVFTCNDVRKVNRVLLDRVRTVCVPPPSRREKEIILRDFLFPRIASEYRGGGDPSSDVIHPDAVRAIVQLAEDVECQTEEDVTACAATDDEDGVEGGTVAPSSSFRSYGAHARAYGGARRGDGDESLKTRGVRAVEKLAERVAMIANLRTLERGKEEDPFVLAPALTNRYEKHSASRGFRITKDDVDVTVRTIAIEKQEATAVRGASECARQRLLRDKLSTMYS